MKAASETEAAMSHRFDLGRQISGAAGAARA